MNAVSELFAAIRESATSTIWSRGVELSRSGSVVGERLSEFELAFQVRVRGTPVAATATLWLDDREWDCDCRHRDDVCVHVAAAVIALKRAREAGDDMPVGNAQTAKLGYRFRRTPEGLALTRVLVSRKGEKPLRHSQTALSVGRIAGLAVVSSQNDTKIELALGSFRHGVPSRGLLAKIVPYLVDCPDVQLDKVPVQVSQEQVVLFQARVADAADGEGFRVYLVKDRTIEEVFQNGVALRKGQLLLTRDSGLTPRELKELGRKGGKQFGPDRLAELVTEVIPSLARRLPFRARTTRLPKLQVARLHVHFITEVHGETLAVMPTLVYGRPAIARVDGDQLTLLGGGLPQRETRAERSLASRLHAELGLTPGQRTISAGAAADEMMTRDRMFHGAEIHGDGPKTFFRAGALLPDLQVQGRDFHLRFVSQEREGFDEFGEGFDDAIAPVPTGVGHHADPERVFEAWRNGEDVVPLAGGGWAPLPVDWLERYGNQVAFLLAARDQAGEMRQYAAPALVELCGDLNLTVTPELAALRDMVEDFAGIGVATLPDDLQAELRDYQRHGVNWLSFMRKAQLGAMLADDMGLGKTVQALCVIDGRTLIVAPTSVLHNWAAELAKFRPALTVGIYHGSRRKLDPEIDVTLTTYAILRLDIAVLGEVGWDMVVLDEAQMIKNSDSQVARAAYRLQADFRLTLTGTPVENRLEELWSQMHFLNPGLLGGRADFSSVYARPIADGVPGVAAQLRKRIRPFLLRRRKQEVAKELPPRTDVTLYCQLDEHEQRVYEAIRAATQEEVVERLKVGGSVLQALEALLRLRQAACHTGLVPGQPKELGATSAKLTLLLDTLEEVVAEGHRALVFSQWTALLDRVEPLLNAAKMAFLRLDGSTRNRGSVVEKFQDDDGPPVLLISLKAGGTGLNLTAADHVFLLDPWWNPATEEQAADRAHRIGQERPVLVHRLVSEGTVEERILALQQRKRALADAALEGADQAGRITREDLLDLLS